MVLIWKTLKMKNEIDLSYDILRSIDRWIVDDVDKNLIAMIIEAHINEYSREIEQNYLNGCLFSKG